MDEWIKEHYELNLAKRAKADELTAAGAYRAKHPKKRGRPPKAKKRGRPAKSARKARLDKGVSSGTPRARAEV